MGHKHKSLQSIQALRGVAALYVVLFHARVVLPLWSKEATDTLHEVFSRGFAGVDLFFVISGFIMAWVCVLSRNRPDSVLSYAIKRFFRVAPPYWLATFLAVFLIGRNSTSDEFLGAILFLPSDASVAPFYGYPLHSVGWTLNYEILFYGIFAIALLAGRWSLLAAAASLLALAITVPVVYALPVTLDATRVIPGIDPYLAMASNPLVLEFVFGIAAAYTYDLLRGKIPAVGILAFCAAAIALLVFGLQHATNHSPLWLGLPSMLLVLGAVLAEDAGLLHVPDWMVKIGEMSFAIYLTHWIVVQNVSAKLAPGVGTAGLYGQMFFVIGATLLVSLYWYRWIEMPFVRFGHLLSQGISATVARISRLGQLIAGGILGDTPSLYGTEQSESGSERPVKPL
ncbi:acyltransferase [Ralstonia syzygii subsp. celebesensis]|uniref:Acyltransferase 3 domain-containing protein n=2 Tax=Ralstonia syzygii subsp. celebesensis TaxID=1310168 RepID=A0A1U9VEN5_9RALS|nr:acyltransferase [Ralstonia syzygii]AQW29139.1 hypothetical protein B0B51_03325 [blood disease bacterium A2-HR MARDI]QQV54322.1 acyltransferase [Ralstonia syzygii subsp. celebesensis]CCA79430.1 putative acyltransferase family protein [blood disease bacterium R229]